MIVTSAFPIRPNLCDAHPSIVLKSALENKKMSNERNSMQVPERKKNDCRMCPVLRHYGVLFVFAVDVLGCRRDQQQTFKLGRNTDSQLNTGVLQKAIPECGFR